MIIILIFAVISQTRLASADYVGVLIEEISRNLIGLHVLTRMPIAVSRPVSISWDCMQIVPRKDSPTKTGNVVAKESTCCYVSMAALFRAVGHYSAHATTGFRGSF